VKHLGMMAAAVLFGLAAGQLLGARAAPLGELSVWVVRGLKALATPLVFFAIVDALSGATVPLKQGARLLGICLINSAVATVIALTLAFFFKPGLGIAPMAIADAPTQAAPKADVLAAVSELVPNSVVEPFVKNNVLGVVVLALLFGLAMRRIPVSSAKLLQDMVKAMLQVFTAVLGWLVVLVPLAVFGIVAKVSGAGDFRLVVPLTKLLLVVVLGLSLQVLWYSNLLRWVAGRPFLTLVKKGGHALVTALSTSSSLATMPVTLATLEQGLGVRPQNARLATCIATNFNNDGIILYEVVAALFVAQATGVSFSGVTLVSLLVLAVVASAGIAGVPEAGMVTLALVLDAAGLSLSLLPVMLTVDWFLGRLRAATNAASDMTVAMLLERFDGQPSV
jgi:Na+/H+-dicarboxylate symporter